MRILLDESAPKRLKGWFPGSKINTAIEMGWGGVKNGRLLQSAAESFDVFVTADKSLPHQQSLAGLNLGIVVLPTNHWRSLQPFKTRLLDAVGTVSPGKVVVIPFHSS